MKLRSLLHIVPLVGLVVPLALSDATQAKDRRTRPAASRGAATSAAEQTPTRATSDFRARIAQVAREYAGWGRVDDELRWAPYLCRMPLASAARLSRAAETTPHARKLYFVYSRDRAAYLEATSRPAGRSPIGQVVVKEAFVPRELRADEGRTLYTRDTQVESDSQPFPYRAHQAAGDSHRYGMGARAGIYVMARVSERGRDTDRGWIYGTVSADGQVTSAGRVASCMGCHLDAPHDRLFGLDQE